MSMPTYVAFRTQASSGNEKNFDFPLLEVFNSEGLLVYRSREALVNTAFLSSPVSSIEATQPLHPVVQANTFLKWLPLGGDESRTFGPGKTMVLSTTLEGCEACEVQDTAVNKFHTRLSDQAVDLIEIRVSSPSQTEP
jgi:hypothetical protein